MTTVYVNNIVKNLCNATIGFETDIDRIRKNMVVVYDKKTILVIGNLVNQMPDGISIVTTFKQLIVRLDNNKVGKPRRMIFFDCKNHTDIALDIYNHFTDWDTITKNTFMDAFQMTQDSFNKEDLAVMSLI